MYWSSCSFLGSCLIHFFSVWCVKNVFTFNILMYTHIQDYVVSDQRKEDQRSVDTQILERVKATPSLRQYLSRRFSLNHGQYPHKMVF